MRHYANIAMPRPHIREYIAKLSLITSNVSSFWVRYRGRTGLNYDDDNISTCVGLGTYQYLES